MHKSKKPLISLVVPAFNEEDNVKPLYEAVKTEMEKVADEFDYEFIFTDNRSTDKTFERLTEISASNERVRLVRFSRNFGYQKSVFTGFCLAAGDCAIEMDCDLQDPPHLILEFIAKWKSGYKVVYGIRNSRKEAWWLTQLRQWFYRGIRFLSDDDLPVDAGDFRLIDRQIMDQLKQIYDASPYLRGTIAGMGFKQIGIPYDRAERLRGEGKFNWTSLISLALDGILNHSIVPLRCATFTGLSISLGLMLYFIALLLLSSIFHFPWPKGFATISVLILISISLNALFLGIMGEYLGRIYRQCKRQPMTIIEMTINFPEPGKKDALPVVV